MPDRQTSNAAYLKQRKGALRGRKLAGRILLGHRTYKGERA